MKRIARFALLLCIICFLMVAAARNENQPYVDNSELQTESISTSTEPEITEEALIFEHANSIQTEPESTAPTINEVIIPKDEDLVEINTYISNIIIDLKYATEDNFTGKQIYDSGQKAMLRYGTIVKLLEAQKELNSLGYTIVVWDAYRPTYAQFKLWDVCPDPRYVANPTNGGFSSHSRGNTIDISIIKLDGSQIEMPTGFDDFSKEADRDYSDISKDAAENSKLLEDIMKKHGFIPYSAEWWHFSDSDQYDVIKEG